MTKRPTPQQATLHIYQTKFPDSEGCILAGSVLRGKGTDSSDLDIVVIYRNVKAAYRESFQSDGWPVEAFVHDLETLNYFFENVEKPSGVPSLPSMVLEGVGIPGPSELLSRAKSLAQKAITEGPLVWNGEQIDRARYGITDLCDDMKTPRSSDELIGTATRLYEALTDFHFRSRNKWSAKGKSIPRRWGQESPELAAQFNYAFDQLFRAGNPSFAINFCEQILAPYGGWLFDKFKLEAPAEWKLPAQ